MSLANLLTRCILSRRFLAGPTGTGPDRVPEAMDPTGDDGRGNLAVTGGESVSKIVILIAATNKCAPRILSIVNGQLLLTVDNSPVH